MKHDTRHLILDSMRKRLADEIADVKVQIKQAKAAENAWFAGSTVYRITTIEAEMARLDDLLDALQTTRREVCNAVRVARKGSFLAR